MWLLIWLSCSRDSGEFAHFKKALVAYDAGRAALERGDLEQAVAQFEEATVADPTSPLLAAWRAHALREGGRLQDASNVVDEALVRFPDDPALRRLRAEVFAQMAQPEAAAPQLAWLLAHEHAEVSDIRGDPSFAQILDDPAIQEVLPTIAPQVHVKGEGGAVLVGELWTLRLTVLSEQGKLVVIDDAGPMPGVLQHQRTVEDVLTLDHGMVTRNIEVTWKGLAPSKGHLGPWRIQVGDQSLVTEPVPLEIAMLPGMENQGTADPSQTVFSIEALVGHAPTPSITKTHLGWVIKAGRSQQHIVDWQGGTPVPGVELVVREAGQPAWRATLYPTKTEVGVTITEGGQEVLKGP